MNRCIGNGRDVVWKSACPLSILSVMLWLYAVVARCIWRCNLVSSILRSPYMCFSLRLDHSICCSATCVVFGVRLSISAIFSREKTFYKPRPPPQIISSVSRILLREIKPEFFRLWLPQIFFKTLFSLIEPAIYAVALANKRPASHSPSIACSINLT